jgi:hypothetical protein
VRRESSRNRRIAALETFIRREDAARFVDDVRGDDRELASCGSGVRPGGGDLCDGT